MVFDDVLIHNIENELNKSSEEEFYLPSLFNIEIGDVQEEKLKKHYLDIVKFNEFSKVLELGCGTGRLTIPLLKLECYVLGFEKSKKMFDFLTILIEYTFD